MLFFELFRHKSSLDYTPPGFHICSQPVGIPDLRSPKMFRQAWPGGPESDLRIRFRAVMLATRASIRARSPHAGKAVAMAENRSTEQKTPRNPHAAFFKVMLDDPVRSTDFLQCHLPAEILPHLADEPPDLVKGSFIDDSRADHQGDVLFRVKFKSGEYVYVHVILESGPGGEPDMPLLVLRYKLRIWEHEREASGAKPGKLTPILTLVVYHGREPWTAPLSISERMIGDPELLRQTRDFRYHVLDLNRFA